MHGSGQAQHGGDVERQGLHADIGVKPRGLVLAGLGHGLLDLGQRAAHLGQHGPHDCRRRGRILLAKSLGMAEIEFAFAAGQGPQAGSQIGRQNLAPPQSQKPLHGKGDGDEGNDPDGIEGPHVRAEPLDIVQDRGGVGLLGRRVFFLLRLAAAGVAGGLSGDFLRSKQTAAVGLGRRGGGRFSAAAFSAAVLSDNWDPRSWAWAGRKKA